VTALSEQIQRTLVAAEELAGMGSWDMDLRTGKGVWSDNMFRLRGLEPQSVEPTPGLLAELIHPDDRDGVTAVLERAIEEPAGIPREGVTVEFRMTRPDGSVREFRARGRVEWDEDGPARWVGTAQDITELRLAEREIYARYAVGQALTEWQSFDEGVVPLLRRLGTALELPIAALWTLDDETGRLTARAFWSAPNVDPGEFEALTRATTFAVGQGVPGEAWRSGELTVLPDVLDALEFRRREAAMAIGIRSALALPAVADGGTFAVLTFFSFDRRVPTERFRHTLSGIGTELGRFLARRRAELEPRRLTEREIEILQLGADGMSGPAIAERLVLSPATVKTHFEHIYEKLGVGDRAAAVAHALRIGLIR
jgi:PAS domain S-box-containing protein